MAYKVMHEYTHNNLTTHPNTYHRNKMRTDIHHYVFIIFLLNLATGSDGEVAGGDECDIIRIHIKY